MENRYLRRAARREFSLSTFGPALGMLGVPVVIYGFAESAKALVVGVALMVFGLVVWATRKAIPSNLALRVLVDVGDVDEAESTIFHLLSHTEDRARRAELLLLLARCAELRRDFVEASEVCEAALDAASEDARDELHDRRAFCLAAAGRVAEAQALVGPARGALPYRDGAELSRPLAIRAQCLTAFQSGEHRHVLELVDLHRAVITTELPPLDRALLLVLEHVSARTLGQTALALPILDPPTTTWIQKLVPLSSRYFDA